MSSGWPTSTCAMPPTVPESTSLLPCERSGALGSELSSAIVSGGARSGRARGERDGGGDDGDKSPSQVNPSQTTTTTSRPRDKRAAQEEAKNHKIKSPFLDPDPVAGWLAGSYGRERVCVCEWWSGKASQKFWLGGGRKALAMLHIRLAKGAKHCSPLSIQPSSAPSDALLSKAHRHLFGRHIRSLFDHPVVKHPLETQIMTVVLPGDAVPLASTSALKLGPGLLPTPPPSASISTAAAPPPSLTAIRAGALGHIGASQASSSSSSSVAVSKPKHADSAAVWVESNTQRVRPTRCLIVSLHRATNADCPLVALLCSDPHARQYVPAPGDSVVAQITNRGADSYTVSLFGAHAATLPALAFEGATKRHKPNLNIGALVYARIVSADRFTEPELTCLNPLTAKSDGFGHLKTTDHRGEKVAHAMLFHTSLGLARSLLRPDHPLLGPRRRSLSL
ncbi:hypothetical protein L1887_60340 [Cichorium endivia]|nr:hypothetical protein L1887_60340 [Cichorium endivia]